MRTHSAFLALPRELRDFIYEYYLFCKDGYFFDFDSGKLRTAKGQAIDLSLMYTCKSIAEEMNGLALKLNTITFSTVYSNAFDTRTRAGRLENLLDDLEILKLSILATTKRHGILTLELMHNNNIHASKETIEEIFNRIGEGNSMVEQKGNAPPGLAQSAIRRLNDDMLRLASSHPEFHETVGSHSVWRRRTAMLCYDVLWLDQGASENPLMEWSIPTTDGLLALEKKCAYHADSDAYFDEYLKFRFSAAASAIHFLESISSSTRSHMRRIVLNEDHKSVARPESHAIGLIKFCQQNPLLRIERRVDLWRAVFTPLRWRYLKSPASVHPDLPPDSARERLSPVYLIQRFRLWTDEALHLSRYGMPPGSFTLIFDGPEGCCDEAFDVIKYGAGWQIAFGECFYPGVRLGHSSNRMKRHRHYISDVFPSVVQGIMQDNYIIRFNAHLGQPWDVEKIIRDNDGRSFKEWELAWGRTQSWGKGKIFAPPAANIGLSTQPPLPSWLELQREDVLRLVDLPERDLEDYIDTGTYYEHLQQI